MNLTWIWGNKAEHCSLVRHVPGMDQSHTKVSSHQDQFYLLKQLWHHQTCSGLHHPAQEFLPQHFHLGVDLCTFPCSIFHKWAGFSHSLILCWHFHQNIKDNKPLLHLWKIKSPSRARLPEEAVDAPYISICCEITVSVTLCAFWAASAPAIAMCRIPKQGEVSVLRQSVGLVT